MQSVALINYKAYALLRKNTVWALEKSIKNIYLLYISFQSNKDAVIYRSHNFNFNFKP